MRRKRSDIVENIFQGECCISWPLSILWSWVIRLRAGWLSKGNKFSKRLSPTVMKFTLGRGQFHEGEGHNSQKYIVDVLLWWINQKFMSKISLSRVIIYFCDGLFFFFRIDVFFAANSYGASILWRYISSEGWCWFWCWYWLTVFFLVFLPLILLFFLVSWSMSNSSSSSASESSPSDGHSLCVYSLYVYSNLFLFTFGTIGFKKFIMPAVRLMFT